MIVSEKALEIARQHVWTSKDKTTGMVTRQLREQCQESGTAFFFKQAGSAPLLDGAPLKLVHRKGGDLQEIPEDLRVREWPRARA